MEFEAYQRLHERIFCENGLEKYLDAVSRETGHTVTEQFYRLTKRMLDVNQRMNLTAVRDPESVVYLHYADSLVLVDEIPRGATLCDVGCGAGFPSLPLAIVREDLSFFAVDSTEKKTRYVAETADFLGFSERFLTCTARAEELANEEKRESFACVTARAVSNLRMLTELCLPLVAVGGVFLAMKGANWAAEYKDAENAIERLGGMLEDVRELELRNGATSEKRCLLTIRKDRSTPSCYPRAWGKIKSKPL